MPTKLQYNFPEAKLGSDFAKEKITEFKQLINSGTSFTVVSMPGVGVSYFLKYLACQDFAHFIYVDFYNLPTLNQHEFYRMLLRDLGGNPSGKSDEQVFLETREILKKLTQEHEKIVIIFSRFDALKKDFDNNFLSNLQGLTTISANRIVLIFTAIKPLYELAPDAVTGGNLPFYSKVLYFKPYTKPDITKLFLLEHTKKAHSNLDDLIEKSGGHYQLLNIFINSHKPNNLLLDKFVTLQLRDLVGYLDYFQKKQIQNMTSKLASHPERSLAEGGRVEGSIDDYLIGVGYVIETKSGYRIFSSLLQEYIKTNIPHKLPVKEKKLFTLLRSNTGRVVSKDEIFKEVWSENPDEGTDWALDALIYRLRNHPFTKSHGYIIESQKKVGFSLIQI